MTAARKPQREILVCEPQFVMRRTLVYTLTELSLGRVEEATNTELAQRRLELKSFDLMVLALAPADKALDLITRLRAGATACPADLPLIVMLESVDPRTEQTLEHLGVHELLRKPFRAKDVLTALLRMSQKAAAQASAHGEKTPA